MLSILKPQEANAIVKYHFHAGYPTSTLHLIKAKTDDTSQLVDALTLICGWMSV